MNKERSKYPVSDIQERIENQQKYNELNSMVLEKASNIQKIYTDKCDYCGGFFNNIFKDDKVNEYLTDVGMLIQLPCIIPWTMRDYEP